MPTKITEIEDKERSKTILRVEGSLAEEDALLLERIALDLREHNGHDLTLDLADLHFIDSDSAPIIKRLQYEHGFEIEGLQIFLQKIVEETAKRPG
ncbi:MAG: hypothetical protein R2747_17235 [Pyrinomonadaceae bacterium]